MPRDSHPGRGQRQSPKFALFPYLPAGSAPLNMFASPRSQASLNQAAPKEGLLVAFRKGGRDVRSFCPFESLYLPEEKRLWATRALLAALRYRAPGRGGLYRPPPCAPSPAAGPPRGLDLWGAPPAATAARGPEVRGLEAPPRPTPWPPRRPSPDTPTPSPGPASAASRTRPRPPPRRSRQQLGSSLHRRTLAMSPMSALVVLLAASCGIYVHGDARSPRLTLLAAHVVSASTAVKCQTWPAFQSVYSLEGTRLATCIKHYLLLVRATVTAGPDV